LRLAGTFLTAGAKTLPWVRKQTLKSLRSPCGTTQRTVSIHS
jgi:hypothetical protein